MIANVPDGQPSLSGVVPSGIVGACQPAFQACPPPDCPVLPLHLLPLDCPPRLEISWAGSLLRLAHSLPAPGLLHPSWPPHPDLASYRFARLKLALSRYAPPALLHQVCLTGGLPLI